jgi:hypothetical protein
MFLYQLVNKVKGFFLAIIIGLSILEVLKKLGPRRERLITKRILIFNQGTRVCFSKTSNYYYSN